LFTHRILLFLYFFVTQFSKQHQTVESHTRYLSSVQWALSTGQVGSGKPS